MPKKNPHVVTIDAEHAILDFACLSDAIRSHIPNIKPGRRYYTAIWRLCESIRGGSLRFHDDLGERIASEQLLTLVDDLTVKRKRHATPPFRSGPMPFIRKASHGGYYRSPQTHNERRANSSYRDDISDLDLNIEISGRTRYLRSSFDDIGTCHQRCWKRQRRTQWKNAAAI